MVRNGTETRVDRRRARTRAALMEAGRALFAERTVDGVAVDDIVAKADVAKGSFYNHFPDKEALAREIAGDVRHEVEQRVMEANRGMDDPARRVAHAISVFIGFASEHPEKARVLLRLHPGATLPDAPLNAGVRADIRAGLQAGRFRDVSLQSGILFVMGTTQIAMSRVLETTKAFAISSHACELAQLVLRGLGVPASESAKIAQAASESILNSSFQRRAT